MTRTQGAIAAKAGLMHLGVMSGGHVRLPLIPATEEEYAAVASAIDALGAPTPQQTEPSGEPTA
jgi:4-hydroxy-tetrahydrodipicolinate synthase